MKKPPKIDKIPKRRLGLRGEVLLYIGILWMVYGFVVYQAPVALGRPPALHEALPLEWRAFGWTATGLLGIVFAFRRWPGADRWGFGALLIKPAERLISWVTTPFAAHFGWLQDSPSTLYCLGNAIVWLVVTLLIYRVGASRQMLVVTRDGQPLVAQGDLADLAELTPPNGEGRA